MLYSVAAHIELVKRNNILGEIIANAVVNIELASYRFLDCQQLRNLHIYFLAVLFANEVNFLILKFTDRYRVSAAQHFHEYYVFKYKIYIPRISAKNSLAYAMVGDIVFFVGGKNLLALQILPFHLIKQIRDCFIR